MTVRSRFVVVRQLSRRPSVFERREFSRDMLACLAADRPRVVLDCERAGRGGRWLIRCLLTWLEEALKRNGDLRLAAVSPEFTSLLQKARILHLFEVYETVDEAVESFTAIPANAGGAAA